MAHLIPIWGMVLHSNVRIYNSILSLIVPHYDSSEYARLQIVYLEMQLHVHHEYIDTCNRGVYILKVDVSQLCHWYILYSAQAQIHK
jgi:hypothetical protein